MRKRKNTPEGVDEKLARVLRANFTQDELRAGLRSQLDEFIKESKVERIFGLRGDLKKFRDKICIYALLREENDAAFNSDTINIHCVGFGVAVQ